MKANFTDRLKNILLLLTGLYKKKKLPNNIRFRETESYERGFAEYYDSFIRPEIEKFEKKRLIFLGRTRKTFFILLCTMPLVLIASGFLTIILTIILFNLKVLFHITYYLLPLYILWVIGCFLHFLEKRNSSLLIQLAILKPLALFIAIPFAIALLTLFTNAFTYPFVVFSIPLIPDFYKHDVKKYIFPKIVSFMGNYTYTPTSRDAKNTKDATEHKHYATKLTRSCILPEFENQHNEDLFKGSYKGVNIEIMESKLTRQNSNSNFSNKTATVFQGIFILLSVHKNFKGYTVIKKNNGFIKNIITKMPKGLERVRLEDPKFEQLFNVFASDQIESRYLLTSAFMQRLNNLANMPEGEGVQASFYKQNLLLMIPINKNLFEPKSTFEPQCFIDDCKSLLSEINMIHEIIDTLELDNNIGM